jgi:hypothetical protein
MCDQPYKDKLYAFNHIEANHLKVYFYECDYCHKKFTSSNSKRQHIHRMHQVEHKQAKRVIGNALFNSKNSK